MNKYRDQLEGSVQLFRIRRLKRLVFLALFMLAILLSVASMALEGASLKPLFLPLDALVAILVILLFLATLAGLVFRSLEIRYAKRDSQRFLLLRASIRRAWTILFLGIILGIVLFLPITGKALNDALTEGRTLDITGYGKATVTFFTPDTFATTQYAGGRLDAAQGSSISVHLYRNGVSAGTSGLGATYAFFLFPTPGYTNYSLVIDNQRAQPVRVQVTLQR